MNFKKGNIDGVVIKDLIKYTDHRGWLTEIWRTDEMRDVVSPVMAYVSATHPGIARGPHEHVYQTDYFVFLGPSTFNIKLWDNRKDSKTYGNFMDFNAGVDNPQLVIVPPGVIHGYKNIGSEIGVVINLPDKLFAGEGKKEKVDEIRHEEDENSPFHF